MYNILYSYFHFFLKYSSNFESQNYLIMFPKFNLNSVFNYFFSKNRIYSDFIENVYIFKS